MRRWVPYSATLAPVALVGGWTIGAARQPSRFDSTRDTISALAAHGAHDRWVMTAGLAVLGCCHVATAAGLREARPAGRAVLAAGGVATIGVAVFAQPSSAHSPVAGVAFVALSGWPALAAVPGRRTGWLAAAGLAALLALFFVQLQRDDLVGLSERVLAGAQALWPLAAVALTARRRPAAR